MKMKPTIFREYDIRGVANVDYDEAFARALGRAVATRLRRTQSAGRPVLALGRDCRLTSEAYVSALTQGALESGVDVVDLGMCPTPLLYFALFKLPVAGGVQVTGSHNPAEYNGFKICIGKETIYGKEIADLRGEIERGAFATGQGERRSAPIIPPYRQFCAEQFGVLPRRLKIVVDAGNGAAGPVAPDVIGALGCDVVPLFCDPDGRFPNHHPDPTLPENLVDVIAAVDRERADAGIAFDGDADRIGVIAPGGRIVWGDELLVILARELLERKPGAIVVSEVKCSQRLYDDVEKHGGKALMWKAGHSLLKAKMKELGAAIGGEMSGHMFFSDRFFGYDDAIYAACRFLEILARSKGGVVDLLAGLPPAYSTPEIRVDCPDEIKFQVAERAREHFARLYPVNDVDGVRINFAEGWGLVRASNTQPALVLRFESSTETKRDEYRKLVEGVVADIQRSLAPS